MLKSFFKNRKGANLAEVATFASLLGTLALALFLMTRETADGSRQQETATPDFLDSRIELKCLTRTRASDTVTANQARNFNCFQLEDGSDRITLDRGDNVVLPGPGHDRVFATSTSGATQITYHSGTDIYDLRGASSILDLRRFTIEEVKMTVEPTRTQSLAGPESTAGANLAQDLLLVTPGGRIIISGHFAGHPVHGIGFSNAFLTQAEIAMRAVDSQISDWGDTVLGTDETDLISPGRGNDTVYTNGGDDIISYSSGHDRYDPGLGMDILDLGTIRADQVRMRVQKNGVDIRIDIPGKGSVTMIDQALAPPRSDDVKFAQIQFQDTILSDIALRARALDDQGTDGDDTIYGTPHNDVIRPGSGRNEIHPGTGRDTIHHQGGQDRIHPPADTTATSYLLDVSDLAAEELSFYVSENGTDLVMSTYRGSSLVLAGFISNPGIMSALRHRDGTLMPLDVLAIALRRR